MPKMHQNMFRGRPPTSMGDAEGSEGRRGREGTGRESPPPEVKVSRINTGWKARTRDELEVRVTGATIHARHVLTICD